MRGSIYEVEWRETPAPDDTIDGLWRRFVVPTDNDEFEVPDVEPGVSYDVRFRVAFPDGTRSAWTTREGIVAADDLTIPPTPTGVRIEGGGCLFWDLDVEPEDLAGYRVRHIAGANPHWSSGIAAHPGIWPAPPFPLCGMPSGSRIVMVKAVDVHGNESETAATLALNRGDFDEREAVLIEEVDLDASSWAATERLVGALVVSGQVLAKPDVINPLAGTTDGAPLWAVGTVLLWGPDDAAGLWGPDDSARLWETGAADKRPLWPVADAALLWAPKFQDLLWEGKLPVKDAGGPATTVSLSPGITSGLGWRIEYRRDRAPLWKKAHDEDQLWGADADLLWQPIESEWRPWTGSLPEVWPQDLRFRVWVPGGKVQPILSTLTAAATAEELVESVSSLSVPAVGARLPLTKTFRTVTHVEAIVLPEPASTAIQVLVLDFDPIRGPKVQAVDGARAPVSATINAIVRGSA